MVKSQWSFKSATELSAALAAKKVSAVELAQEAIGRIERHDGKINAICVRDFDRGLEAARAADAARARGIVVDVPDAQVGQLTMHNIIPRLADTPGKLRTPAPEIGEHTAEILGQLGIDQAGLQALAKEGIVGLR